MTARSKYERMRAVHLNAIQAALVDHTARLDWTPDQIERYREHQLRALLCYARQRSPFHARRLRGLDLASATVADLASLPMMTKAEARNCWDDIVTDRRLNRERAERILTEQEWYSYTPDGYQVFSSGGSSGIRGVYVWSWQFLVSAACLAWRMQVRAERREPRQGPTRLAVLEAGMPPHASTPLFDVPTVAGMETVVIAAGAPFDEVR
ncbi:MAG TPA: phenylacetate--CoA ligase family protein, partial [Mycobacterium sp.]|nr:phenylacetate--CoA ligase family protein [Mycobacterium sp.]